MQPIVCIVGPTGNGKTGLSLDLARRFCGGVVNFDSRQIYAGLPIITAQPSPEELAVCPHRLYDAIDPCEPLSAARFIELAHEAIAQTADEGLLPLLVGGTGMYLRTLLHGIADIPDVPAEVVEELEARVESEGSPALHAELAGMDPELAARIHPNDRQRIVRGLSVHKHTGTPLSEFQRAQADTPPRYRALKIGLEADLDALTPLLQQRIEQMLATGALEEMRAALGKCPDEDAPGYSAIGCAEVIDHLRGRIDREEMVLRWTKRTRAYAKRQLTWFRADPEVRWFAPAHKKSAEEIGGLVDDLLSGSG